MEKSIWFEGHNGIECNISNIKKSFDNHGKLFVSVIKLMPGLTSVDILEEANNSITIKTSEGIMKRTNISKIITDESVLLEFDEEYQAGRMIKVSSHCLDEFTVNGKSVKHRVVLSDVKARGVLGFFYRNFGKSSIGNAILNSYKTYFDMEYK